MWQRYGLFFGERIFLVKNQVFVVLFFGVQPLSAYVGQSSAYPVAAVGGRSFVGSGGYSLGSPKQLLGLATGGVFGQRCPIVGEPRCHRHLLEVRLASG